MLQAKVFQNDQSASCLCRHSRAAHMIGEGCTFCSCDGFEDPTAPANLSSAATAAFDLLAENGAFKSVRPTHLANLVRSGQERMFVKGEALLRQGETSRAAYIVLAGQVNVEHRTARGRVLAVASLGPGEPVGEIGILLDDARMNTATAATDVLALEISAERLSQAFEGADVLFRAFETLVQNRLRTVSTRVWA